MQEKMYVLPDSLHLIQKLSNFLIIFYQFVNKNIEKMGVGIYVIKGLQNHL